MAMNKALVIGIDDYPSDKLDFCVHDATQISLLLANHGNGDPNFDVNELLDVQEKHTLNCAIRSLFASDDDIQLLYFAGHGMVTEAGGVIVTPDCRSGDEGISMRDIMNYAKESKAKSKVIILDCCHSGNFGNPSDNCSDAFLTDGMTILTACRRNETAQEDNGHGIFTSLLIEALQGGAADFSGKISPGGVYSYIDKSLGSWDQQRPVFKTNVSQFISLREVSPKVSKEVLRKLTKYFSDPHFQFQLSPSFEDTNDPSVEHEYIEPYAIEEDVKTFKNLQKLQSIGLVTPVDEDHMYFAAMKSKKCKLTAVGAHYWKLVKNNRI